MIWEGGFVVYFKVLYRHLPTRTEENHEPRPLYPDRDCNGDIPITKQVCQPLYHIRSCVSDVAVAKTAECIRLVMKRVKRFRGPHC
jgi:hypothetical protein